MRILISAAEGSSDAHGAELLKALRELCAQKDEGGASQTSEPVEAFGIGGPRLEAEGLRTVVDCRELLAMGFFEILGRLPKIFGALRRVSEESARIRPDVAVVIDYPDFHFRLAKRLRKQGLPVIYFIPPKVWAWRKGRIQQLRLSFRKLLCILPFESEFYSEAGVPAVYVGNPLFDELPLQLSRAQARTERGLVEGQVTLVLMPGSRPAELKRHLKLVLEGAARLAASLGAKGRLGSGGKLVVLLPLPVTVAPEVLEESLSEWKASGGHSNVDLRISQGDAHACLVAADVGLIKSGTSTLEAGALACPHALFYKPNWFTEFMFKKIIRYRGPIGLVNLVYGGGPQARREDDLVREMLSSEVTPDHLAREAEKILLDEAYRARMERGFAKLKERLFPAGAESPSLRAAKEVMATLLAPGAAERAIPVARTPLPMQALNLAAGAVWSTINWLARAAADRGLPRRRVRLTARVISVGNIQAGGTGKTPLVAKIAREAAARGLSACILTRGYGSSWEAQGGILAPKEPAPEPAVCGDETALLRILCPSVWIGIGSDRERQFDRVLAQAGKIDVVILDDGLQNFRLIKDVEIIACTSRTRREALFRDWPCVLRQADLVVWTKGAPSASVAGPSLGAEFALPEGELAELRAARGVCLVTGVGDPQAVAGLLRSEGVVISQHLVFPDHARYSERVVREIWQDANAKGILLATTGKDWVKWKGFFGDVCPAGLIVLEPEVQFKQLAGQKGAESSALWEHVLWGS